MRENERAATKGDLQRVHEATKADLRGEIRAVRADFAHAFDGLRRDTESKFEKIAVLITQTRSDLMSAYERALTTAQKVDHDQLYTHDRLDSLEQRVTSLETRRKRRPS